MGKRRKKPAIQVQFGFAVRTRREALGLTQEDLADKAQIHRTYVSDIERGSRNVSLVNIDRLAASLAISLPDLFKLVIEN